MSKSTSWIVGVAAVAIVGTGVLWFVQVRETPAPDTRLDAFAQCLASKNVTMYGASWCSHCAAEKARFGSSFQYVPYVECPDNPKECVDAGIQGYPTWILGDGTKLEGERELTDLAAATGCQLMTEVSASPTASQ